MASDAAIQNLLSSAPRSLRRMLAHWLTPTELRRRKDVQLLIYLERMRDPRTRAEIVAQATPPARALLANVIAHEGDTQAGQMLATTAAEGYPVNLASLGELHYYGLAFLEDAACWPWRNEVWSHHHACQAVVVPDALHGDAIEHMTPDVPVAPCLQPVTQRVPSHLPAASILLTTFLDHISAGTVRLTQQGNLTLRSRKALADTWPSDAPNELYAAPHMLAFACSHGIAKKASTGVVVPGPKFAAFRHLSRAEQTRQYLDYSTGHAQDASGATVRYGFAPRQCALAMIRTILGSAAPDAWLPVTGIIRAIIDNLQYVFSAQPGKHNWTWDVSCYPFPQRRTWRPLVTDLIMQWYHPSGVVECGTTAEGALCVRLTSLGAFWLTGQGAPEHDNEHQQLVVQPDFTVILTHSGPWDRTAQVLNLFATRRGDDNASVFRFSRDTVRTAVKQGHAIDTLLELLDTASSYPVPANVRQTLVDWSTASSALILHRDTHLFEFDTRAERDGFLEAYPALDAVAVTDRHALARAPESAVLDAMQRVHAVPVDYTHAPIGGIDVHADGEVVVTAPDDLRLIALRNAIAAPRRARKGSHAPARWYLSVRAMQRARAPQQVFERLIKVQARPFALELKVLLMVELGLVKRSSSNRYALVEQLTSATRAALKEHTTWRISQVASLTRDSYVMPRDYASELEAAAAEAGTRIAVRAVDIASIPVHP